jgi:hypothetical protein
MAPIEINFYEWGGGASLTLKMDNKRVPATMLYHEVDLYPEKQLQPSFMSFNKVGCFADSHIRAIPDATEFGYDNNNYKAKTQPVTQCAEFARSKGFKGFAVQDSGWCATSPDAHMTYMKYGPSKACAGDKGGPWANDVYAWS